MQENFRDVIVIGKLMCATGKGIVCKYLNVWKIIIQIISNQIIGHWAFVKTAKTKKSFKILYILKKSGFKFSGQKK